MRHPLHALCPYFAMFPEGFVLDQLLAFTSPGELVLDPFAGRGTTLFESLLNGRRAIGTDINKVAACVTGAKIDVPQKEKLFERLDELERAFWRIRTVKPFATKFFSACYSQPTYQEIEFLRTHLNWRVSKVDRFIAALVLGSLHGESHKSKLCLSNRMPRTISTKPEYSVRWWNERGYIAPKRETFNILRAVAEMRYGISPPQMKGKIRLADARRAGSLYREHNGEVKLVVNSPPYIDTTDYAEDQWLRLWFLGGPPYPKARVNRDDRYSNVMSYWSFLSEVWAGCARLFSPGTTIVVRIGGKLDSRTLLEGVRGSLQHGLKQQGLSVKTEYHNSSLIKNRQTNSFRPGTNGERREFDFVFKLQ